MTTELHGASGFASEREHLRSFLSRATLLLMLSVVSVAMGGDEPRNPYLGASHVPASQLGWRRFLTTADPRAPKDEPMGGKTARGTLINPRSPECFPAEYRNLFSEVDKVASGKQDGQLMPFDFTNGHGAVEEGNLEQFDLRGREAIRGQNTWMLWGEGNETFWGWLQEQGYGLADFLVLLDSRSRDSRFQRGGLINQPGMRSQRSDDSWFHKKLGLYLDEADGDAITLKDAPMDIDAKTGLPAKRIEAPVNHRDVPHTQLFTPGDAQLYSDVLEHLPKDGVDPDIYGYPSGVVGLRLMPNPDFFGSGPGPDRARAYWTQQVVAHASARDAIPDAYYTVREIQQDPELVRPFRVSMSCAFCHLGPHPLNPPADVERPKWENLSSTIGNQYWVPQALFANLTEPDSLLYQFLASQQPGTVDTSLVSTDHINNANTITAVFDVPARLARADENAPEAQNAANLLSPIALYPTLAERGQTVTPRHTPRVLLDGADSIGAFGALSRVYLNIGTFSEEWSRLHNPIIGFKPQRPFSLATLQSNSVYWQTSERYRIPYLVAFFTYKSHKTGQSIVAPMKLADTLGGPALLAKETTDAQRGRAIYLHNCAICHSSKQPAGFALQFSADWVRAHVPASNELAIFTLPRKFEEWEAFRASAAFKVYGQRIDVLAGEPSNGIDDFLKENFLSTDVRIPITLVGTNSGRAVGTNGMRGQVWDNFSSETYKNLPAVGAVRFYNPFSHIGVDVWGNNDTYYPPGGGPGYYRPASLISVWATAPYLHNNTLGIYSPDPSQPPDPSVAGRLRAFDDGIDRLFWRAKRVQGPIPRPGDLRWTDPKLTQDDPGFIYRTTEKTSITFPRKFIRPLFVGLLGEKGTSFLTLYLWLGLALLAAVFVFLSRARHAAFLFLLFATVSATLIAAGRLDKVTEILWLLPAGSLVIAVGFWCAPADARTGKLWAQFSFGVLAVMFLTVGVVAHKFVDGAFGDLNLPGIPKGTPINLLMNINPEAPPDKLFNAVMGLTRGLLLTRQISDPAQALAIFQREAGQALLEASKCPDFVLDRGHWFAEGLTDDEKRELKAFLKTL